MAASEKILIALPNEMGMRRFESNRSYNILVPITTRELTEESVTYNNDGDERRSSVEEHATIRVSRDREPSLAHCLFKLTEGVKQETPKR